MFLPEVTEVDDFDVNHNLLYTAKHFISRKKIGEKIEIFFRKTTRDFLAVVQGGSPGSLS